MHDPRIESLARLLIKHSLELGKRDKFLIRGSVKAYPLLKHVYIESLKVGAHPEIITELDGIKKSFFRHAQDHQLKYVSPCENLVVETYDAHLAIAADVNTREFTNVDPEKQKIVSRARKGITKRFLERSARKEMRWCLAPFPTNANAQEAGMSLEEYEEFVFTACRLNTSDPIKAWKEQAKRERKIVDLLGRVSEIRILAPDTDLTLSTDGRKWIPTDARNNMPDGEIFTAPLEDTVEGYIRFSFPGIYQGREVENIRLKFKEGKVVEAKASKGGRLLRSLLDVDEDSRYVGEFAVGTNYNISRFTRNMLFDEKIGGTIHLAIGAGYPDTGSKNKSGIHWDMLCDMKNDGVIYADGDLIYRKGKLLANFK